MLHVIRPVNAVSPQVAPKGFESLKDFEQILEMMAYSVHSTDPWNVLGLAPLEGPDISPITIAARMRFVKCAVR